MIRLISLALLFAFSLPAFSQSATAPFSVNQVGSVLNGVTSIDFSFDGSIYIAEKNGQIKRMAANGSGGYLAPTVFVNISSNVFTELESGLLGMALDPDFQNNRHIYAFYTTSSDQRLVRFTASADYLTSTLEENVLSGLPRNGSTHKAGDIHISHENSDHIYISYGDDNEAQNALNLSFYHGKILKIDKNTGLGLADNPFVIGGDLTSVRSRIFSYGHRNPFRIDAHPSIPGVLYVSENGNSADKLSRVEKGSNGGWDGTDAALFNPPTTGEIGYQTIIRTFDTATFGALVGVLITENGPFADPSDPNGFMVYMGSWNGPIYRYSLTGTNLDIATPLAIDGGGAFATFAGGIDMRIGPDGWMYSHTTGVFASLEPTFLTRIEITGAGVPSASFNASPTTGDAPLTVNFTDTSVPVNPATLTSWLYNFGDGNESSSASPSHQYVDSGEYTVTLFVTDSNNIQDSFQFVITVTGAVACDDLSGVTETLSVQYSQVQALWNNYCLGCHAGVPPAADLDLSGDSQYDIVNIKSKQVFGQSMIDPGNADGSYLFEKVNCSTTQVGGRMPGGGAIPLADQALLRDWINQSTLFRRCYPFTTFCVN